MIINSKVHGLLDYLTVIVLWLSPTLFALPNTTSFFLYILGGIHLLLTVLTNFEFGLIRLIPFKVHGWIELTVGIILVPLALYFNELEGVLSRNYLLCLAVVIFVTWALTNYKTKVL